MSERIKHAIIPVVLVLIGLFFLYKGLIDPDFGWHYKYGEYFFSHHQILNTNIFSYTNENYKWINTYWLFDVILYFLENTLGHVISTFLISLVASASIYYILNKVAKSPFSTGFSFLLSIVVIAGYNIAIRPHVYSTVFMFFLLYALLAAPKLKKFFPFIFIIWANIHADFVIALFILGIYSLNNFYLDIKTTNQKTLSGISRSILNNFYLVVLCFLATLINPNGLNMWITLIKELTLPVKAYVQEWNMYQPKSVVDTVSLVFITAIFLAGGLAAKFKNGTWYKFLVVFLLIFSIKAVYMTRLFFIVSTFGLANSIDQLVESVFDNFNIDHIKTMLISIYLCITIIFITLLVVFTRTVTSSMNPKQWATDSKYPYAAVEFIKASKPEGNMFNNYNWGGYLIWKLPEYKTFIDGRMTSWRENGKYFMADYLDITKKPDDNKILFNEYATKYNISWIIDYPNSKFVQSLETNKWKKVFEDKNSVVLERNL